MSFQDRLKELRIKNNLSQKKLADAVGVAQSSINYWESGQRIPSIDACARIAEYFDVNIEDLLDLTAEIEAGNKDKPIVTARKPYTLNNEEAHLLKLFDRLNNKGQEKATEQLELLTKIPEYRQDSE